MCMCVATTIVSLCVKMVKGKVRAFFLGLWLMSPCMPLGSVPSSSEP